MNCLTFRCEAVNGVLLPVPLKVLIRPLKIPERSLESGWEFPERKTYSSLAVWLILFSIVLYLQGCGLSGSSGPAEGVVVVAPPENVIFDVSVVDGILENVQVQLVSLRRGPLGGAVSTGSDGKASIVLLKAVIDDLDNEDLLFYYAESSARSILRTDSGNTTLRQGQVRFRSLLPPARTIKSRAELFNPVTSDQEIQSLSELSHFSNSRTLLVEDLMRKDGIINQPIKPDSLPNIIFTTEILTRIDAQVQTIDDELDRTGSTASQKFKLLATATKAIVERGIAEILLIPSQNWTLEESEQILFELAATVPSDNNALHPNFFNAFSSISQEITRDLTSGNFALSSNSVVSLLTITEEDTRNAFELEVEVGPLPSTGPVLTTTTPLRSTLHFLIKSSRMQGPSGVLQIDPSLIPVKTNLKAPELSPSPGT